MNRRMKTINTFEFLPVHVDENVNCIISITGYLQYKVIFLPPFYLLIMKYEIDGYQILKKMKHHYHSVHSII